MRFYLIALLLLTLFNPASAQVWPGDVNANGIVNNVDLLYLGYAYGTIGPRRDSVTIEWEPQEVILDWEEEFPGGAINYSHADCNGDGLIAIGDILAIASNYRDQNATLDPEDFSVGQADIDPMLAVQDQQFNQPILEGTTISVPISLGDADHVINDFNGLAFSVEYDPAAIDPSSIHLFFGNSWINDTGNSLLQIQQNHVAEGRLDVAISRYGKDAVTGNGFIGDMYFIIVDDVIDLLPADSMYTYLTLTDIVMLDSSLQDVPLANDTLEIKVVSPAYFVVSTKIIDDPSVQIYPNPAKDVLHIQAPQTTIQEARLSNSTGQIVWSRTLQSRGTWTVDTSPMPSGFYLLRLDTPEGILLRKLMVLSKDINN
ncbi:MAG: T9SS type A sorting domain-containing protein [Bacteroidota bacterium]